ncbi:MAG: hypothetical protein JW944_12030 [Deltaproteobacteria bacterium]|nr:hypothetical protein [Deltaproteobacteria bacterium]
MTEDRIIKIIKDKGPLTGSQLLDHINEDPLILLRACRLSRDLAVRIIGTRYLRLDRKIDGFARLSPSILREFLTYSVIGLKTDMMSMESKAEALRSHIEKISRYKSELAYNLVSVLAGRVGDDLVVKDHVCFMLAGDIVFNMAHDVPRPERSTRKKVLGSDIDIVAIVDKDFPETLIRRLDDEIYREKGRLLVNPYMREEIDYIVKDLDKVTEQMKFDTFKHMVACKIMHEGAFLYGSEEIFQLVKSMLRENGVIFKINSMEEQARVFREQADECLVKENPARLKEMTDFFYPAEESEEFE